MARDNLTSVFATMDGARISEKMIFVGIMVRKAQPPVV